MQCTQQYAMYVLYVLCAMDVMFVRTHVYNVM